MAQIEGGQNPKRSGKKWKNLKKIGFHIDMTPYVDVIMLLLTFFIMTTTLNQPQVMQVNLPKGDGGVKIPMNNCLFIRVTENGKIGISPGREDGTEEQPQTVNYEQLRNKLEFYGGKNKELTMIVKFHPSAKYETMIGVIDEINRAGVEKRYSFSKTVDADLKVMKFIDG